MYKDRIDFPFHQSLCHRVQLTYVVVMTENSINFAGGDDVRTSPYTCTVYFTANYTNEIRIRLRHRETKNTHKCMWSAAERNKKFV